MFASKVIDKKQRRSIVMVVQVSVGTRPVSSQHAPAHKHTLSLRTMKQWRQETAEPSATSALETLTEGTTSVLDHGQTISDQTTNTENHLLIPDHKDSENYLLIPGPQRL